MHPGADRDDRQTDLRHIEIAGVEIKVFDAGAETVGDRGLEAATGRPRAVGGAGAGRAYDADIHRGIQLGGCAARRHVEQVAIERIADAGAQRADPRNLRRARHGPAGDRDRFGRHVAGKIGLEAQHDGTELLIGPDLEARPKPPGTLALPEPPPPETVSVTLAFA